MQVDNKKLYLLYTAQVIGRDRLLSMSQHAASAWKTVSDEEKVGLVAELEADKELQQQTRIISHNSALSHYESTMKNIEQEVLLCLVLCH
jgi:uncharacterized protein YlxW (UPF0749 family)